jgi:hypothetical protein
MLVENWKEVLRKAAVVWVGVLGALLPELPDLVLKWLASDESAQVLSVEQKNWIRAAVLFFVIPLARVWQQQSLSGKQPDSTTPKGTP